MNSDAQFHFSVGRNLAWNYSIIMCSQHLNVGLELCLHHCMKNFKYSSYFLLFLHKKHPCDSCVVIDECHKPSKASNIFGS